MRNLLNLSVLFAIALLVTLAPGGGAALSVILTVLSVAFFTAIGFLGYRLYREHRAFTLDSMADRERLVLYAAVGLAFLTFAATARLFAYGGLGVVVWLALLGLSSLAVFRAFSRGV